MLLNFSSTAQQFNVNFGSSYVNQILETHVWDFTGCPVAGTFPVVYDDLCVNNAINPGVYGTGGVLHQYGGKCFSQSVFYHNCDGNPVSDDCWARAQSKSRVFINGDGSQHLSLQWLNLALNQGGFDCGYWSSSFLDMHAGIDFSIGSYPPGTPINVYYTYTIFAGANTAHEAIGEDPIYVAQNSLELDGTSLTGGAYSFGPIFGWNQSGLVSGSFVTMAGTNINVSISSLYDSEINPPTPGMSADVNDCIFIGFMDFYINPVYPTPTYAGTGELLFSIDIGSHRDLDNSLSIPFGTFDIGDMYARSTLPNPVSSGYVNDADFLNTSDPIPTPGALPGLIPYHSGTAAFNMLRNNFFNLDGSDHLPFSLSQTGGAYFGRDAAPGDCLYGPQFMLISYDDDNRKNWAHAAPGIFGNESLPVESFSEQNFIYGSSQAKDEIYSLVTVELGGTTYAMTYPVMSESELHAGLAPNPDLNLYNNAFDDDVNSLDFMAFDSNGQSLCGFFYFTVDHQAPFNLEPGIIYEKVPNGLPLKVIEPYMLGLSDEVDIDAFEFTVINDMLAILFSVDEDDPMTAANESGGLNPRIIYYSHFDGQSQPFISEPLKDNVDAITLWATALPGAASCTYYRDLDGDGWGDLAVICSTCFPPPGYVLPGGDCNDNDPTIYPGAPGTGMGVDNNCNGIIDPAETICILTGFIDSDGDGHGDPLAMFTFFGCTYPPGISPFGDDCNDPTIYPGAPGTHQCVDNNCDGIISNTEAAQCQGDFNGDGNRNVTDLLLFIAQLGCQSGCGCYDLNGDGQVNTSDLLLLLAVYGIPCP